MSELKLAEQDITEATDDVSYESDASYEEETSPVGADTTTPAALTAEGIEKMRKKKKKNRFNASYEDKKSGLGLGAKIGIGIGAGAAAALGGYAAHQYMKTHSSQTKAEEKKDDEVTEQGVEVTEEQEISVAAIDATD
jgi:hypothetical protein